MSYVSHLGASPRRGRRCWPFLELPDAGNEKGAMARDPLSFWRSRCFDLVVSTPSLTVPKYMEAQLQSNSQLRNSQSGNCLTSPNSRTYIYIYSPFFCTPCSFPEPRRFLEAGRRTSAHPRRSRRWKSEIASVPCQTPRS